MEGREITNLPSIDVVRLSVISGQIFLFAGFESIEDGSEFGAGHCTTYNQTNSKSGQTTHSFCICIFLSEFRP